MIAAEDLAVDYRIRRDRPGAMALLRSLLSRGAMVHRIQALRGVSFTVPRGATLGLIGVNGAGKSTLLRTIAGIIPPSRGRVTVRGEVMPLLSLGVGFNKELTGRDNVTLGALAAGLDGPEVSERSQDIIRFAELGEFIDYPVRSYSSGMRARLGFSVAVHIDSDVLLIDETLSVGDVRFKEKCQAKLSEMCGAGRTVIIVSHGVGTVLEMTSECLWLHDGRVMRHGLPGETVEAYMRFLRIRRTEATEDPPWQGL